MVSPAVTALTGAQRGALDCACALVYAIALR